MKTRPVVLFAIAALVLTAGYSVASWTTEPVVAAPVSPAVPQTQAGFCGLTPEQIASWEKTQAPSKAAEPDSLDLTEMSCSCPNGYVPCLPGTNCCGNDPNHPGHCGKNFIGYCVAGCDQYCCHP